MGWEDVVLYLIGAIAACLGLGVGIGIGFLIASGSESRMPFDQLLQLEDEAGQLEREVGSNPSPVKQVQLGLIRNRLRREARKARAAEVRMARVERIRLRANVLSKWLQ